MIFRLLLLAVAVPAAAPLLPAQEEYLGAEACGQCHEEIYQSQSKARMARTWRRAGEGVFQSGYSRTAVEGPFRFRVHERDGGLAFSVRDDEGEDSVPVAVVTGGERFGIGFLLQLEKISGLPLMRPVRLEARYMHDTSADRLVRSPGHEQLRPTTRLSALGRVLQPGFETRCLTCHGSPAHSDSGAPGVHCERCHGPGRPHLDALDDERDGLGILNPARWDKARQVEFCAQCHSGFIELTQPRPRHLLIAEQARALRSSECFVQSGGQISCLDCHDPHRDATAAEPAYDATCRGCHALEAERAAPCPVQREKDCTRCHMPKVRQDGLDLVDHWIRVPIEQKGRHPLATGLPGTRVAPRKMFLRLIEVGTREEAEQLRQQLSQGADFDGIARQRSLHPSANLGGFLGPVDPEELPPPRKEAARGLRFGQLSEVFPAGERFGLLRREARDFRQEAWAREDTGARLLARGDMAGGLAALLDAVRIYPESLMGHQSLAFAYGRKGDLTRLVETLETAQRLFPDDPPTAFLLARAYAAARQPERQLRSLEAALRLDPEMVPAHLMRGALHFSRGEWEAAGEAFERAARLNPLSAVAYFNLAETRRRQGRVEEASRWQALARALGAE